MKTCLLSHEFVQLLRSAKKGLFQIPLQAEVWLAITKEKTFFVVADSCLACLLEACADRQVFNLFPDVLHILSAASFTVC